MRSIAWLAKHVAPEHDDCVCPDDNTGRGFSASGICLAPRQKRRVGGKRHGRCGKPRNDRRWRSILALFAIGAEGAKWNAKKAEQLTAARRGGGKD